MLLWHCHPTLVIPRPHLLHQDACRKRVIGDVIENGRRLTDAKKIAGRS
jgi:hypothetical protein